MNKKNRPTLRIISYWEEIKELLNKEDCNIYCDCQIIELDRYFNEQIEKELYGKSSS